jgi:hypothetical protein
LLYLFYLSFYLHFFIRFFHSFFLPLSLSIFVCPFFFTFPSNFLFPRRLRWSSG